MCGEHDDFFFVCAAEFPDHVAGGIDLHGEAGGGQKSFEGRRTLAFLKGGRGNFRQAGLLVIDPREIGLKPGQRRADLRVFAKLAGGGGTSGLSAERRANRHNEEDNPNEDAFHCPAARSGSVQWRVTSAHSAEISASVNTRGDCLAASKMRLTRVSSAGILRRSSQKSTLDLPLIGPITMT